MTDMFDKEKDPMPEEDNPVVNSEEGEQAAEAEEAAAPTAEAAPETESAPEETAENLSAEAGAQQESPAPGMNQTEQTSTPRYASGNPWQTPYAAPAQNRPTWNGNEYSYRPVQGTHPPHSAQGNTQGAYTSSSAHGAYNGFAAPEPPPPPKSGKKPPRAKMSKGALALLLIVCILLSAAAGYGGASLERYINRDSSVTDSSDKDSSTSDSSGTIIHHTVNGEKNLGETTYSVANVVEAVADSVVEIVTEKVTTSSIFGQYVESGAGSGVIISSDGLIITCAHVIDGATTVTVTLPDGTEHVATVVGSDAQTDIAAIRIDATDLAYANIGDSDALIVGEPVIAIGNPLGELGGTVTSGIISALEREVTIDGTTYTLLQTDAAVNSGNSGGALFDINGNLIGIVNAKQSGSGIEGLGFAIPINGAMEIVDQLDKNGYVKGRPMFGISLYDIADESALYSLRGSEASALINYVTGYGVYFVQYEDGQSGDLQFGDRIVAIDGVSISGFSDIKEVLAEHSVGDTLTITVSRVTDTRTGRAKMIEVPITLIESNASAEN